MSFTTKEFNSNEISQLFYLLIKIWTFNLKGMDTYLKNYNQLENHGKTKMNQKETADAIYFFIYYIITVRGKSICLVWN